MVLETVGGFRRGAINQCEAGLLAGEAFGELAAVYGFCRVARALHRIPSAADVLSAKYVDDYPVVCYAAVADATTKMLKELLTALGRGTCSQRGPLREPYVLGVPGQPPLLHDEKPRLGVSTPQTAACPTIAAAMNASSSTALPATELHLLPTELAQPAAPPCARALPSARPPHSI